MTLGDFSQQAQAYSKTRPGYPRELLDQLIVDAGVSPDDPVVDLGAGTGIFTSLLVERGFRVTAVEPNGPMRSENQVPTATWIEGTFEATSLGDGSQRWATAAQSFHWADPARSLPEIRRILGQGGVFTILWNNRLTNESELLRHTENTFRKHVPGYEETYRQRDWPPVLESTGDFSFIAYRSVAHHVSMSKERYLDLWHSHNRLNTLAGPERFAAAFQELETYVRSQPGETFQIPYRCDAWSARRRD